MHKIDNKICDINNNLSNENRMRRKRIAIVTFLSDNYGTCLQAYALKKAIETFDCYAEVLSTVRNSNSVNNISVLYRLKQMLNDFPTITPLDYFRIRRVYKDKHVRFDCFKQNYLCPTNKTIGTSEELETLESTYDYFVSGSDMVWSAEFYQYLGVFFLESIPYSKCGSYAPSFGDTTLDEEQEKQYEVWLNGISSISCRERSGINLVYKLTHRNATYVLDPTMLFTGKDWLRFFSIKANEGNYLLVNCFGSLSEGMREKLPGLQKALGLEGVRYLNSGRYDVIEELKYGPADYGPIEFVRMISESSYIIVNGYHGLLFALLFEKPFIVLHRVVGDHWGKHEGRMYELLHELGLEERYVNEGDTIQEELLSLNYGPIQKRLNEMRIDSWSYLSNMLQSIGEC